MIPPYDMTPPTFTMEYGIMHQRRVNMTDHSRLPTLPPSHIVRHHTSFVDGHNNGMQRAIMTSIPFLRQPSSPATADDIPTANDLADTLDAHRDGCVGMAANMIGISKRIIAFVDADLGGRITVMLNPSIVARDGEYQTSEGCLSLQGERRTTRYERVELVWQDLRLRERHGSFSGFTAQIIQHEVDHCEGIII